MEHERRKLPRIISHSIPEHLVFDHILTKLPAKSLVRFKSVSKRWQSTISSHDFAKFHFSCSSSAPPKFIILGTKHSKDDQGVGFSLSYQELDCNLKDLVQVDFAYDFSSFIVMGSCNGLVCLYNKDINSFWIWNPATRQYSEIILTSTEFDHTYTISAAGFCYVSSLDDYHIVALVSSYGRPNHIELHSLTSRKSRVVHMFSKNDEKIELQEGGGSVVVDDVMYWPPERLASHVVRFNLVDEELITKPAMAWMRNYREIDLFRIKGCLSLCCRCNVVNPDTCDVWTLKRHEDWNSWEKLFDIDLIGHYLYGFSSSGVCLVGDLKLKQLKFFDPSEETPEQSKGQIKMGCNSREKAFGYVESLVWPTIGITTSIPVAMFCLGLEIC